MEKILLPELGEDIEEAEIVYWHYSEGDIIKKDDNLVEIATDKATFNIATPFNGVLKKIVAKEGQKCKIGATIAEIDK